MKRIWMRIKEITLLEVLLILLADNIMIFIFYKTGWMLHSYWYNLLLWIIGNMIGYLIIFLIEFKKNKTKI